MVVPRYSLPWQLMPSFRRTVTWFFERVAFAKNTSSKGGDLPGLSIFRSFGFEGGFLCFFARFGDMKGLDKPLVLSHLHII